MNAKHQFKYTYTDTDIAEISPVNITFDMPGDVTITQMLFNFECYLRACGFVFDGQLQMVPDAYAPLEDELDGTLYEFKDEELHGACMTDFDAECGCEDNTKWEQEAHEKLNAWNEGIAKLDNELKEQREIREKAYKSAEMCAEVAKNKWVHGMCNPPSADYQATKKNK